MLVKIAKAPYFEGSDKNSFMLVEAEEIIRFQTQPYWNFDNNKDLEQAVALWNAQGLPTLSTIDFNRIDQFISAISGNAEELSENKIYRANFILIRDKQGKEVQYSFDTIAYICNDEGKTLEKCFAGGVLNK